MDLIRQGIKSTLFGFNKEIFEQINKENLHDKIISFSKVYSSDQDIFKERISLLLDPQTCGPLLISCNPKYESALKNNWYKIGKVIKKNY